jgi:hypothetical protein
MLESGKVQVPKMVKVTNFDKNEKHGKASFFQ